MKPCSAQGIVKWSRFVPDTDGGVRQDLPVTGPSSRRPAGARGTEARRHWIGARVGLDAHPRLEKELPDTVDFHERVVELGGWKGRWQLWVRGTDAPTGDFQFLESFCF